MTTITFAHLESHFDEIVDRVADDGERFRVECSNGTRFGLVTPEDLEMLRQHRVPDLPKTKEPEGATNATL